MSASSLLDQLHAERKRIHSGLWTTKNKPLVAPTPPPPAPPAPPPRSAPSPTVTPWGQPLKERLAEVEKLRGLIPWDVKRKMEDAIRGSAADFGEVAPREYYRTTTGPLTISEIQKAVAWKFALMPEDIRGQRHKKHIVRPRQMAMFLSRLLTKNSFPAIGRQFGGRDHTTVLAAVRKIEALIEVDRAMAKEIRELIVTLKPSMGSHG